ncbi:MAG: DeoR family transcriptional regulator [Flavobacteriales bacterium]|jgi:predicted DNA-binding transcriptional regulator YafY|nr:DeoR family transcriptional regulator [Flavobacteriales bacterium]
MTFAERKRQLEYLLEMVEEGRCISTQQVAEKFDCSKRTAKRMLDELRDDGNEIVYCKQTKKFRVG